MKKPMIVLTLAMLALTPTTDARAGQHADDEPMMQEAVEHYAAIGNALARDTVDGVADHAQTLRDLMPEKASGKKEHGSTGDDHKGMHGDEGHHESMAEVHATMNEALESLSAADTSVEEARSAFADLSAVFVPMAQKHAAASEANMDYVVVHCPMAPGDGDWIQKTGKTANPYHGEKMLRCGNQLGALGASSTGTKMHERERKPDDGSMHGSKGHGEHGHDI